MPVVKTVLFLGWIGVFELIIRAWLIYVREGIASDARYFMYAALVIAFILNGMANDLLVPL